MWKGVSQAQKGKYSTKQLNSGSFLSCPQSLILNREYAYYIALYYDL